MQGIYKITNLVNNKCYIGKTNNIERRWQDHKRLALTEGHKEYNKVLYQAMRKYGLENFIFEIIENLDDYSISGEREQYWIKYYDSYYNGYNESFGGDGGSAKGHCAGESNGRAKLTKEDVITIRKLYQEGMSQKECFELFKEKITLGGFKSVWTGRTWKDVMPEVFTEENKQRNARMGRGLKGKADRKLSPEEVQEIRKQKKNGESPSVVYIKYCERLSKSSFDDIWYNRTYLDVEEK